MNSSFNFITLYKLKSQIRLVYSNEIVQLKNIYDLVRKIYLRQLYWKSVYGL